MAKESDLLLIQNQIKMIKKKLNNEIKTTTLSAEVAISKTETGMDYVQVMPDNPCVGLLKPFCGWGRGQLLSNGAFDFLRKIRIRKKPELKLKHSSLSYGQDGLDRYLFHLPNGQRDEFAKLLLKEVMQAIKFMNNREEGGKE